MGSVVRKVQSFRFRGVVSRLAILFVISPPAPLASRATATGSQRSVAFREWNVG